MKRFCCLVGALVSSFAAPSLAFAEDGTPRPLSPESPGDGALPRGAEDVEDGGRARVHIESGSIVYLYRRGRGTDDFVTACGSPCDAVLPLGDRYKIGGAGLTTTAEFRLKASPGGRVNITVRGPNSVGRVTGGILMIGGAFTAVVVGIAFGSSAIVLSGAIPNGHPEEAESFTYACIGGGALAAGLGLLVFIASGGTDVTQKILRPHADAAPLRVPLFRSPAATERDAAHASFPVLFQGRF